MCVCLCEHSCVHLVESLADSSPVKRTRSHAASVVEPRVLQHNTDCQRTQRDQAPESGMCVCVFVRVCVCAHLFIISSRRDAGYFLSAQANSVLCW